MKGKVYTKEFKEIGLATIFRTKFMRTLSPYID